jgi:hypothetical protein
MIRVCAWCNPEKDATGSTIGEVMGCSTENNTYNCTECDSVMECRVKRDWTSYSPLQRSNCSATHGLCSKHLEEELARIKDRQQGGK